MSSGKTKQIFSLLKWRKGKKQKNENEKAEISDDLDYGSCQFKQEPSLFGRSQSEDSGLDLSNPICLYQKIMPPDMQENNCTHSRHTSNNSSLYSYLSYDSKSRQLPRSLSFTALSGGENEIKAAQSPTDDDVFGLQNIAQTYNLARLTNAGKCDLAVTEISKKETEKEDGYKMNSNIWSKESKWKTTEESDFLEVVGCHGQFRRSSLESQVMSRSTTNQLQMGMLYRLCSLMEKIMELERDRMELLRQNNELQDQLTQSQQAQETFLSFCTCDAKTGVNTLHTATQQTMFVRSLTMREKPTTETTSRPSSGDRSERPSAIKSMKSPVSKFSNAPPTLQKLPQCTRCETGIIGAVVKARDKLYHPACFMCSDCGLNLKQKGYFFIEEQLYCETHAKARVQPPEGYEVVAVYPNSRV